MRSVLRGAGDFRDNDDLFCQIALQIGMIEF